MPKFIKTRSNIFWLSYKNPKLNKLELIVNTIVKKPIFEFTNKNIIEKFIFL